MYYRRQLFLLFFILLLLPFSGRSQELFPIAESASNIPKGALVVKLANEAYEDISQLRFWQGYTFTYGINSKLSISQTYSFSNHHPFEQLPSDFIQQYPSEGLYTQGYIYGRSYPYSFEGLEMELKWRFLNIDGDKKHFRMAAYLQLSGGNEPHMSAAPDLTGDNSGLGAGIIASKLINKFATSVTIGGIVPHDYIGSFDSTRIHYGNALNYSLSFGYLLLPFKYTSYKQTNITVYLEFTGETYDAASVYKNSLPVYSGIAPSLAAGSYVEARPAIQFIFLSNTRVDISLAYLLAGHYYEEGFPVYYLSLQHTFNF